VDSISTAQSPGSAGISFRLESADVRLASARHEGPTRIVLRFGRGEDVADSDSDTTDASGDPFALSIEPWDRSFAIRRVILDPGHGGSDVGGSSARGEREKDLTLAIARRVRDALAEQAPDLDVRLTREDDRFLTNADRSHVANEEGADLFLSIHCDGWFDDDRRGFSITTWGRRTVEEGWSLPASAVRVDRGPRETERIADVIARAMDRALSMPNRGVSAAELQVLEGLHMPGLVIECGMLTNADDRKLLVSESFQSKVAGAIADGVLEIRDQLGVPDEELESGDEDEDAADHGDENETR
jgi:N-acetylmuramoyl-L-alanine amidase